MVEVQHFSNRYFRLWKVITSIESDTGGLKMVNWSAVEINGDILIDGQIGNTLHQ